MATSEDPPTGGQDGQTVFSPLPGPRVRQSRTAARMCSGSAGDAAMIPARSGSAGTAAAVGTPTDSPWTIFSPGVQPSVQPASDRFPRPLMPLPLR